MSVTETSKKAYKEITDEGIRKTQLDSILEVIDKNQSRYSDCAMSLREIKQNCKYDINAISGRVNELKKLHKVYRVTKRKCTITNRLISPVRKHITFKKVI